MPTNAPTIEVARMEARSRALALLTNRLTVFTLDAPARPYTAEADPYATEAAVDNWKRGEALVALIAIVASGENDRHHLTENLRYCLDLGAIEPHSPAHLAIADLGASL